MDECMKLSAGELPNSGKSWGLPEFREPLAGEKRSALYGGRGDLTYYGVI